MQRTSQLPLLNRDDENHSTPREVHFAASEEVLMEIIMAVQFLPSIKD